MISLLALDIDFAKENLIKLHEVLEPDRICEFLSSFEENHFYLTTFLNA